MPQLTGASAWAPKGIARQAMSAQGMIQKPVIGTASALAATGYAKGR